MVEHDETYRPCSERELLSRTLDVDGRLKVAFSCESHGMHCVADPFGH